MLIVVAFVVVFVVAFVVVFVVAPFVVPFVAVGAAVVLVVVFAGVKVIVVSCEAGDDSGALVAVGVITGTLLTGGVHVASLKSS